MPWHYAATPIIFTHSFRCCRHFILAAAAAAFVSRLLPMPLLAIYFRHDTPLMPLSSLSFHCFRCRHFIADAAVHD